VAVISIGLYLVASVRFFQSHRRKPSVMLIALITAAALLAEAMATIIGARSWQLSWWLWHVLMAAAFGFVAYSAYSQYQREGGSAGLFDGIVSQDTTAAIREEYGGALETLTNTLQRSAHSGMTEGDLDLIIAGMRMKFSLTEGQGEVLARAARALASERDQTVRLGALVEIATEAGVERDEDDLLETTIGVLANRFAPDVIRVGIRSADGLSYPDRFTTGDWPANADRYARDLIVGTDQAGVVEFARKNGTFREADTSIMDSLVSEMGIAIDNVRLYRQLDALFRTYLSPDVAETLRADPSQAGLGGSMVELTALFADLRGFTTFTEQTDPEEVMEMLNRYFGDVVPIILGNGGTVVQFVGDALLAVFDAPRPRPDHAFRAAKSGLAMQRAIAAQTEGMVDAPRFRIGINTGVALMGNIGAAEFRSYNVVGDAVNVASRLETSADPGTVVIGEPTYQAIADRVVVHPLGPLDLKGKSRPINAYRLDHIRDD
jgi:class 3 adenylate cyclase